jgi:hypothetical protein
MPPESLLAKGRPLIRTLSGYQRKVLKDCEQMISPSEDRVKEAYQDLSALVVSESTLYGG